MFHLHLPIGARVGMFIYTSSCFGFILDCINQVRSRQVREKEETVYIRGLFVSFNIKEPYLEIVIQGKKFNTLAVFRHI